MCREAPWGGCKSTDRGRGQECRDVRVWGKGIGHRRWGLKHGGQGPGVQSHRVIGMRSLVRHGGIVAWAQWAGLESLCSPKHADDKNGLRTTEC